MKRISLLSFLLIICLLFSACNANKTQPVMHVGPPRTIRSIDDFNSVINAPNLSNRELNALLDKSFIKNYHIGTKEQIKSFASHLLSIPFPVVNDSSIIQSFQFEDYDGTRYHFIYFIGDTMYDFQYRPSDSTSNHSKKKPACYFELDGESLAMYLSNDRLGAELYRNGYQIIVTIQNFSDIDQVSLEYFTLHHPDGGEPNT